MPNHPTRIDQLVNDPSSWAFGLAPAQAKRVFDWLQARGFLEDCACGKAC